MTGLFYLSVGILALCGIWLVWELGFKADGTRVRRPLSEVCGRPGLKCWLSGASTESKTLICL